MRILSFLFLFLLCASCKKEEKNLPVQETPTTQNIDVKKEHIIRYPDTTRYDSIKSNFSLTSLNFNENRIDFTLLNRLEDFQIEFSNIPNDRVKIGYIQKENAFYIDQEKASYKRTQTKKHTDLSIVLDSLSISLLVNGNAIHLTKDISITKPYTVMTFSSKKHVMTNVVVSKVKYK